MSTRREMPWQTLARQSNNLETTPNREAKIVPLAQLHPMPNQPRRHVSTSAQDELMADIKANGILNPLLVRPRAEGGYWIIGGGRRYAAAKALGDVRDVPVIIKDLDEDTAYIIALADNIQRVDLDPADEAAYVMELYRRVKSLRRVGEIVNKNKDWVRKRVLLMSVPGALAQYQAGLLNLNDLVKSAPEIPDDITLEEAEQLLQTAPGVYQVDSLQEAEADTALDAPSTVEHSVSQVDRPTPTPAGVSQVDRSTPTPVGVSQVDTTGTQKRTDYQRRVTVLRPFAKLAGYVNDLDPTPLTTQERQELQQQVDELQSALEGLKRKLAEDQGA